MTIDLRPYVAVGPLHWGMERAAVQAILGPPESSMAPFDLVRDDYPSIGLWIEYDAELRCAYVALAAPIRCLYQGKDLLCLNVKQLSKLLADDAQLEVDGDTLTSRMYGIGAVFTYKTKPVERITAFKRGYYDKSDAFKRKLETLDLRDLSTEELWDLLQQG